MKSTANHIGRNFLGASLFTFRSLSMKFGFVKLRCVELHPDRSCHTLWRSSWVWARGQKIDDVIAFFIVLNATSSKHKMDRALKKCDINLDEFSEDAPLPQRNKMVLPNIVAIGHCSLFHQPFQPYQSFKRDHLASITKFHIYFLGCLCCIVASVPENARFLKVRVNSPTP